MGDSVESAYESLSKLDSALISSAKNAATLSRGISKVYKLQAGKNWEIVSRFISGSGLWKVQNKMRAVVQVLHQFTDAGNKAAEASAKQLNKLTELTDAHKTLKAAQELYTNGMTDAHRKALMKKEEYIELETKLKAELKTTAEIEDAVQQRFMENQSSKYKALTELVGAEKAKAQMLKEINLQELQSMEVLERAKKDMRKALNKEEVMEQRKAAKEKFKVDKKLIMIQHKGKMESYRKNKKDIRVLENKKNKLGLRPGGRQQLSVKDQKRLNTFKKKAVGLKAKAGTKSEIPNIKRRADFENKVKGFFKNWGKGQSKRKKVTDFFVKAKNKIGMFLKTGVTFLGYALLGILGLFLVIGIVKKAWGFISKAWEDTEEIFDFIYDAFIGAFTLIYDAFIGIWDFFVNGEGTWLDFVGYLADIAFGLFALAAFALAALITLLWVGIKALGMALLKWLEKDLAKRLFALLLIVGAIWIAWYYIALFAAAFALTTGFVVMLVAGIALVIYGALKAIGWAAKGGPVSGMTVVGEKGPELLSLPNGSRVTSNADSRRLASGGGNTINVHVNGRVGASDKEIRDIANKVAKLINVEMNRSANVM